MNLDENQKSILAFIAMLILALIALLYVHHSARALDIDGRYAQVSRVVSASLP